MLNIISNEIFKPKWLVTGQTKVFRNLIKGLEKINYPYVLNKKHDYCDKLWIYNDLSAVEYLNKVDTTKVKVLIGPDFLSLKFASKKIQKNIKNCVVLQPSKWTHRMSDYLGFNYRHSDFWPVGVNTNKFLPSKGLKDRVLVYFKQRFDFELNLVIEVLKRKKINYSIIIYGNYKENDYQNELRCTRYIIWIGQSESQGIAMGEALASNIPILVWEISCLGHWQPSTKKEKKMIPNKWLSFTNAKVAPYFDLTCGHVINYAKEIGSGIDFMENNLDKFKPREYILKNLSLEKQAKEFVNLFEKHWNDDIDSVVNNSATNWKNYYLWKILANIFYGYKKIKKFIH